MFKNLKFSFFSFPSFKMVKSRRGSSTATRGRKSKGKAPVRGESSANPQVSTNPILPKFIDAKASERYTSLLSKSIIVQRPASPSLFDEYNLPLVKSCFEKQNWGHLIHIDLPVYHDMVLQFTTNLRKGSTIRTLISRVNSTNLEISSNIINTIFECEVPNPNNFSYFFSLDKWPTVDIEEVRAIFNINFKQASEAKTTLLTPELNILYTLVTNLLLPTDGHRTELGKMQLYLIFCVFKGIPLDFGYLFCSLWKLFLTDTRKNIPFGKFLTKIFDFLDVPFSGNKQFPPYFNKSYIE
ncbi:hypothetical protein ACH5RR_012389 [Cinchona calisaya]|uniref:Putative plant transposon protein domain-containing protein n=1 Tax=Cinchona calisaya TaxID=153742 RepID=A0ABD3ADF8_9GENT